MAILTIAVLSVTVMGQESCDTSTEEPEIRKGDSPAGASDTEGGEVAAVGDTLSLKGTAYTVNDVETTSSLGSSFTKVKANGVFVVVDLTLENEESEPATILEDNLRLIGGNGSEYTTSTDGAFAINDAFVLLEEIQPGVKQSGKLVYDVPENAARGSVLQVEDLFSSSVGQIDLGL